MLSTIEVSSTAIRLCRVENGHLTALERWPVPQGADPLAALAAAPLPQELGRVRVLMHHDDLLVRSHLFPAGADDRLERLVRFEVESGLGDAPGDVSVSWCHAPLLSSDMGETPVLVQMAKHRLVDRVRQALAPSNAKLDGLGHPVLGLVEAFRAQGNQEAAILLDIGGRHVHAALVLEGRLVFQRTITPGIDDLVERLAARRGLAWADAARLLERLDDGSPEDLRELLVAAGRSLSTQVAAALRFARTQCKLTPFEPAAIHITGAGAQVHGLAKTLRQGLDLPVRLLNPFADRPLTIPRSDADRLSGLPGEWGVVVGGAAAERLALDALETERRASHQRFITVGMLRLSVIAASVLMIAAVALVATANHSARKDLDRIAGIHPKAIGATKEAVAAKAAKAQAGDRLAWLDGERRTGRIVPELLTVIASLQDLNTCPIQLAALRARHAGGQTVIELEGSAQAAPKAGTDRVLHAFERGLKEGYPAIAQLESLPRPIDRDRHPFSYRLTIPDRIQ